MRYPVVLQAMGICLLFCLTAFAASKKEDTSPSSIPASVSENPPAAQNSEPAEAQAAKEVVPETSAEAQPEAVPVQEAKTAPNFKVHKVWLWQESRDCLWNIAKKYYNDPWQWKKIYLANKNQIKDPRYIYPRQVLIIPPEDEPEQ